MAATAKSRNAKKTGAQPPENPTPSEAAAYAILAERSDLAPSVEKIMQSDVGEQGRLHAIGLFRDSLGVDGDPMRYPANAIEAGRLFASGAEDHQTAG
jgi:hypothetical protein